VPFEMPKKKSLVIGGSRGLGLAIADELAARGLPVTIASRYPSPTTSRSYPHISCDLSRISTIGLGDLCQAIAASDLVFVVAAQGCFGEPATIPRYSAHDVMATTFVGNVLVLSHAVATMPRGSSVCWISSLSAHAMTSAWAYYAASKAGVSHFIECIRPVASGRNVSLTVAYPGNFESRFHDIAGVKSPDGAAKPADLAGQIIDATIDGSDTWIAPMDRDVLSAYLLVASRARERLAEALR